MTNVAHDLYRQTEAAKMVLAQYADILGDDAQAKADTVEGETNLKEAIEKALARVIEIDALEDSIKGIRVAPPQPRDGLGSGRRETHRDGACHRGAEANATQGGSGGREQHSSTLLEAGRPEA